jgi:cell division protein FtsL
MRLVNLIVVIALVLAAAYVYKIKFDSTVQAERVAKLRTEIRRERDSVASLRAEWSKLDNPSRLEGLAKRHLTLKPIDPSQLENFDQLPQRPLPSAAEPPDPIGAMIDDDIPTGSATPAAPAR